MLRSLCFRVVIRSQAEPIGLQVARTAKTLRRAFDEALTAAGGSLPSWLVLLSIKSTAHGTQRELAEAVGVEGPTLTHHLNRMEEGGLLRRRRDPLNRRVHLVELTDDGEAAFSRLVAAAIAFDGQLRRGVTDEEIAALGGLLARLRANASDESEPSDPSYAQDCADVLSLEGTET
jgi:MarR family transcriptional regulator for hemolysin